MFTLLTVLGASSISPVWARVAHLQIARISTPVAVLEGVQVRLEWPAQATTGTLWLHARQVRAEDLGYRWRNVSWRCPLRNVKGQWRCRGEISQTGAAPLRLEVDIDVALTQVRLSAGNAALSLTRNAASPDLTQVDLSQVPIRWVQALVAQGWADARLKSGRLAGRLQLRVPAKGPLQVSGPLKLSQLGLDTPDGSIAAEGVNANLRLDYRQFPGQSLMTMDGQWLAGELLVGSAYLAPPTAPVQWQVAARRQSDGRWELPQLIWDDGTALQVQGSLGFDAALNLSDAALQLRSDDLAPLQARYLSGWLGLAGLSDLRMQGRLAVQMDWANGEVSQLGVDLHDVEVRDGRNRFHLWGINGQPWLSGGAPRESRLHWQGGQLNNLAFGAATFALTSQQGALGLRAPVTVPALGGGLTIDALTLHPPRRDAGFTFDLGLSVDHLDMGQIATALQWPAFRGQISGRIPRVRYAQDRLDFEGALTVSMFDGRVQVSGLSMERPFGTAPTLSADIELDDLDLQALTSVFGFGEIIGALDGHIRGLRLVDWSPQRFDAELHTDPQWRGRQRISQRAVQDLSSVGGGGGLGGSLQAQALKLFDDFGYRNIGIRCRLAEDICQMDGLGSAGDGFIIVQGKGLPRLSVVGFNRRVDWPTLVQRLGEATRGQSKPVIE